MKFFIISNYYPPFLEYFWRKNPELREKSFEKQKIAFEQTLFGIGNFYKKSLERLGHEVQHFIVNDEYSQKAWAKEKNLPFGGIRIPHLAQKSLFFRSFLSKAPFLYYFAKSIFFKKSWMYQILQSQLTYHSPDVILVPDLAFFPPFIARMLKKYAKVLIGHISQRMPPLNYLTPYDIIISSYPHYVENFQKRGLKAFYLQHAFDPKVWEQVGKKGRIYDCSFVGGLSNRLKETRLFEEAARKTRIDFWGDMNPPNPLNSPIWQTYHGQAWGKEMYEVYAKSKIVVNRHVESIAKQYANNLRLYEATGMGALLITDWKENLHKIFEIGKEVETYRTVDELVEKIEFYKKNEEPREKIARAGQKRTFRDHSYQKRVKELLNLIVAFI